MSNTRLILWCYFIWYLAVLVRYFDPNPQLWLTSLGLAALVGFALYTNARSSDKADMQLERWQTIRFFLTPFCVSSFSALVKGKGFFLTFSPRMEENLIAAVACLLLWASTALCKKLS